MNRFCLCLGVIFLFASASTAADPTGSDLATPPEVTVSAPVYPKVIDSPEGQVVIHMPQIDSWQDFETLTAWAALEVTSADSDKTWIGSIQFSASTDIDFDERLVVVHDIEVSDKRFQDNVKPPQEVIDLAGSAISLKPKSVPLDVVLRGLPEDFKPSSNALARTPELKFDPPVIFVSTSPANLMMIDGDAVKAPIKDTDLEFVVNTNWDLFWDKKKERWYVLNDGAWQRTDSLHTPDWKTTKRLPKDLKNKLPDEENWAEVKKHIPAKKPKQEPPRLLVSFSPAELILIDGEPRKTSIAEAGLEWVENTEADLFVYQGEYYYLVSGRWFHATRLDAGWTPVKQLPENFSHIPADHPRGHVLASVPGTLDARAAAIEAQIPRKAQIAMDAGQDIEVAYAGDPQFVDIEGTGLKRAANTSYQVIQVGEQYYLCYNAVWFVAPEPTGPWVVATEVPDAIYGIPASDPAHNTTYVYVYPQTSTTTTHVSYGYTSGYYGMYFAYGALVYGTGWYHNPYYYYYPWGYPAYWRYPMAYGHGAWYNPVNGRYGQRTVAYGPYGGAAATSVYNPRTGTYARGWSAWDHDELARSGYAYNPRTGTYAGGNMYYDFDDNRGWREGYVQRGDRWVHTDTEWDGNRARTEFETGRGVSGVSNRERNDGVTTGSGEVHRGNRSAQTTSRIDNEGAQLNAQGDRGGSVDVSKEWGTAGRQIEATGADGRSVSAERTRTQGGNQRTDFETSTGGQGTSLNTGRGRTTVGQSANGDLYASRNGEVYRRGNDGDWSNYNNGSWNRTQSGGTRSLSQSNRSGLNQQWNARQSGSRNFNQFKSQRGSFNRAGAGRARGGRRR